jgi:hypothetical protein
VSIRDDLAAYDEAAESYAESEDESGGYVSGRNYENWEDSQLEFAEAAQAWVRAALEALEPEQIEKVDRRLALNNERASHVGTP